MKSMFKFIPVILMVAAVSVAGCGDPAASGTGGDSGGADTTESGEKGASNTPSSNDMVSLVSADVDLPKMHWTWGSCCNQVSSALNDVPEITNVKLDPSSKSLTFDAKKGFDVEGKLTELTKKVSFFEDFELKK